MADTGDLSVRVLDVGHGDAALLSLPGGERTLIDGGTAGWSDRVVDALPDGKLDRAVATHFHGDHFGGIARLLTRDDVSVGGLDLPEIGSVYRNAPDTATGAVWDCLWDRTFMSEYYGTGRSASPVVAGRDLAADRDDVQLDVLSSPELLADAGLADRFVDAGRYANEASGVVRASDGETTHLFTGDAGEATERLLVALYGDRTDEMAAEHRPFAALLERHGDALTTVREETAYGDDVAALANRNGVLDDVDVLHAGHHGVARSEARESPRERVDTFAKRRTAGATALFLDAVDPAALVVSAGLDDPHGAPSPRLFRRCARRDIGVAWTGAHGDIRETELAAARRTRDRDTNAYDPTELMKLRAVAPDQRETARDRLNDTGSIDLERYALAPELFVATSRRADGAVEEGPALSLDELEAWTDTPDLAVNALLGGIDGGAPRSEAARRLATTGPADLSVLPMSDRVEDRTFTHGLFERLDEVTLEDGEQLPPPRGDRAVRAAEATADGGGSGGGLTVLDTTDTPTWTDQVSKLSAVSATARRRVVEAVTAVGAGDLTRERLGSVCSDPAFTDADRVRVGAALATAPTTPVPGFDGEAALAALGGATAFDDRAAVDRALREAWPGERPTAKRRDCAGPAWDAAWERRVQRTSGVTPAGALAAVAAVREAGEAAVDATDLAAVDALAPMSAARLTAELAGHSRFERIDDASAGAAVGAVVDATGRDDESWERALVEDLDPCRALDAVEFVRTNGREMLCADDLRDALEPVAAAAVADELAAVDRFGSIDARDAARLADAARQERLVDQLAEDSPGVENGALDRQNTVS